MAAPTLVVFALLAGRASNAQEAGEPLEPPESVPPEPGPSEPETELEQKKEEARAYFLEGVDLFDGKDYAQALEKFRQAFDLVPHWSSRFNIGMCHYYLGDHPHAIVELLAFLEEAETEAPAEMTQEARKIIDLIRGQHVATITVSGVGDQAEVTVDGEAPSATSGEGEIFLTPGPHAIKVTQGAEVLLEDQITAKAGESKELRVYVKEKQPEPVKPVTKSAGPRPLAAAGWAAVGLAGASLVVCAVTGGLVIAKKNEIGDLEKKYGDAPPDEQAAIRADAADLYDQGVTLGNVSTAFFVITAAAAAAGTALLVVDLKREKKTGAAVSLAASPGGIMIQGSF